jgi:hypothetical protein
VHGRRASGTPVAHAAGGPIGCANAAWTPQWELSYGVTNEYGFEGGTYCNAVPTQIQTKVCGQYWNGSSAVSFVCAGPKVEDGVEWDEAWAYGRCSEGEDIRTWSWSYVYNEGWSNSATDVSSWILC